MVACLASASVATHGKEREIVVLLLQRGARVTDTDSKGRTVAAAATSDWIRALLDAT